MALFDARGSRKYLCARELPRFLDAASRADPATASLCFLLAYTGCRLSEALALAPAQLDVPMRCVVFRTLKRRRTVFRAVPVPNELMLALCHLAKERAPDAPLWGWCRQTAWRRVKRVMAQAGIEGAQATPKGLRHGFGVANAQSQVPMATTQKWLGHAKLETTAIYQQAVGSEERALARRLWRSWQAKR
ncbi:MAG: site-specific integrase [Alphaproteobacteria bacterium]|nr:site-specific integrase [Alphaproteobacteria bacterium]